MVRLQVKLYHIHFDIISRWTGKPPSPRGLEISDPVYLQSIHRHLKVHIAGTAEI
ncbi:hypothetical protein ALP49_200100 [Pseudomonas syringae pv. solidagae]|nr:hypothetical protein ALP49_200100 [Pseudomonas syringae pv. solidagae]